MPAQQGPVEVGQRGRIGRPENKGTECGRHTSHLALSIGPEGPLSYGTEAGSGPRRLTFHRDGRTAYLLNELTADIHTLRWDPRAGTLTRRQTLSVDSQDFTGTRSAAEMTLSPCGNFLYVSSRGEDSRAPVPAFTPSSA
ncbi:beta-propeller fold lactonase family protein [Streptomyces sp. NPDC048565]|uniref:lactonase family protein n=1 Tax=Streptomyces sp. NPDC048565 TaxID=3155266 RepID=UPI00343501B3